MDYASILFNEPPLVVSPKLAKIIGLNEAIILQQIHYWLQKSPKIRDDRAWTYNSYTDWLEQLPFRSTDTIKRTINKLTADGLVIKGDFNKTSFDKTSWYTIDYEALNLVLTTAQSMRAICTNGTGQFAPTDEGILPPPIPETITKTISESKKESKKESQADFNFLIAGYTQNQVLQNALVEFIKMRIVTKKKPPTNYALELIFKKLDRLASDDNIKVEILNQSILNGWQDIYEMKTPPPGDNPAQSKSKSPIERAQEFFRENE